MEGKFREQGNRGKGGKKKGGVKIADFRRSAEDYDHCYLGQIIVTEAGAQFTSTTDSLLLSLLKLVLVLTYCIEILICHFDSRHATAGSRVNKH